MTCSDVPHSGQGETTEPGLSCRDPQIPVREQRRESFRIQTLQAWEEYRVKGMHLNADEVDDWLIQLEQGADTEPPPCHL